MENRHDYTSNKTSGNLNNSQEQRSKWLLPAVLTIAVIAGFALFMTNDNDVQNIEPASGYSSTNSPETDGRDVYR